jgi:hypothetical protein
MNANGLVAPGGVSPSAGAARRRRLRLLMVVITLKCLSTTSSVKNVRWELFIGAKRKRTADRNVNPNTSHHRTLDRPPFIYERLAPL